MNWAAGFARGMLKIWSDQRWEDSDDNSTQSDVDLSSRENKHINHRGGGSGEYFCDPNGLFLNCSQRSRAMATKMYPIHIYLC